MSRPSRSAALITGLVIAGWVSDSAAYAQDTCLPLPSGFELCAGGTIWQDAESFGFEDAVVLESDDLWLEVMPLPDLLAELSLDAIMDSLEAEFIQQAAVEGQRAPQIFDRISFQTPQISGLMMAMTEFDYADEYVVVTAVVHGNGRHVILALDGDAAFSASEMEQNMRNISDLIRLAEEG